MVVDPARPSNLYAHFDCVGIWKSTNFGATWNGPINTGTNGAGANGAGTITIAPGPPGGPPILYSGAIRGTGLGFWKSVDGGVSWTQYMVGPAGTAQDAGAPLVDPYDGNHLVRIGHETSTIFQSFDGGVSWSQVNIDPGMVAGGSGSFGFINTGNASTTRNTWLWLAQGTALCVGTWRTTDGGAHWTKVSCNEHAHGGAQIYQPDTNGVVYMAGIYGSQGWGIYRSTDYGQTWAHVGNGGADGVVFGTPNYVYAGYGWACQNCTIDANLQVAAQPGLTGWTQAVQPSGMGMGPVNAAVTFDGTHYVALTANMNSGLWRLVEGASALPAPTNTPSATNTPANTPVVPTSTPAATVVAGLPNGFYTTAFPLTENPISEAGVWRNGGTTGLDWTNIRTTPGKAFGTQAGNSVATYDDSIAVLNGAFTPDQQASGTVFNTRVAPAGDYSGEVEVLLRFAVSGHSARGYEINFSTKPGTNYVTIVRWNGPVGSFTPLVQTQPSYVTTGAVVSGKIVGNVITGYINGVQVIQATDNTFATGNPGMGFYVRNISQAGDITKYGFTSYTAQNVGGAPTSTPVPPTPTRTATPVPPTGTPVPPTSTPIPPAGLRVVGNRLLDGGQLVQLRGVNRSGSEYMCQYGPIFDGPVDQASIDAIKAWGVNTVRVPLNQSCWLGINGLPANGLTASAYRAGVQAFVDLLTANGLYTILDLHWTATAQTPMPDADTPAFWTSVATTFAPNHSVLFDLFNEPYPDNNQDTTAAWTCLRDGCNGAPGMQQLVTTVRATGAQNVIMSPGILYSGGMSRWLEFKPTDPTGNLAASWHTYAPNGNQCNTQACWDSVIAPILASVPLVAGEIGQIDCQSDYITALATWLDAHQGNYLAWAWDTYDCSGFPSLVSDYSGTPTNYGLGFRDHLLGVTPTATPTATPVPPTSTPVPPTSTPVPPTATPVPMVSVPAPPSSGCFVLTATNGVIDPTWRSCTP